MTTGERIKDVRNQLGISQVDFADKINVSKQTLYKYENNIVANIPFNRIEAIAQLAIVSPAYLMGWTNEQLTSTNQDKVITYHLKECDYMSDVKERIFGAVTIMSEKDAEKIWELIQATFVLGNAEEVPAEPEEIEALDAYQNENPEYQPCYTREEMLRELGLEK